MTPMTMKESEMNRALDRTAMEEAVATLAAVAPNAPRVTAPTAPTTSTTSTTSTTGEALAESAAKLAHAVCMMRKYECALKKSALARLACKQFASESTQAMSTESAAEREELKRRNEELQLHIEELEQRNRQLHDEKDELEQRNEQNEEEIKNLKRSSVWEKMEFEKERQMLAQVIQEWKYRAETFRDAHTDAIAAAKAQAAQKTEETASLKQTIEELTAQVVTLQTDLDIANANANEERLRHNDNMMTELVWDLTNQLDERDTAVAHITELAAREIDRFQEVVHGLRQRMVQDAVAHDKERQQLMEKLIELKPTAVGVVSDADVTQSESDSGTCTDSDDEAYHGDVGAYHEDEQDDDRVGAYTTVASSSPSLLMSFASSLAHATDEEEVAVEEVESEVNPETPEMASADEICDTEATPTASSTALLTVLTLTARTPGATKPRDGASIPAPKIQVPRGLLGSRRERSPVAISPSRVSDGVGPSVASGVAPGVARHSVAPVRAAGHIGRRSAAVRGPVSGPTSSSSRANATENRSPPKKAWVKY